MSVKEGRLLAAVVVRVPPGPRADDPLDEVAHGKEQQQDQDAGQLPREPADVVEKCVDGELAAAHLRAGTGVPCDGGRTAVLVDAALDLPTALGGLTCRDQACRQKCSSVCCPAAARHTGHHPPGWSSYRRVSSTHDVVSLSPLRCCRTAFPSSCSRNMCCHSFCSEERDSRCPPSPC